MIRDVPIRNENGFPLNLFQYFLFFSFFRLYLSPLENHLQIFLKNELINYHLPIILRQFSIIHQGLKHIPEFCKAILSYRQLLA